MTSAGNTFPEKGIFCSLDDGLSNLIEKNLLLPVRFFELRLLKRMLCVITLPIFRNITGFISVQTGY